MSSSRDQGVLCARGVHALRAHRLRRFAPGPAARTPPQGPLHATPQVLGELLPA